MPKVKTHRGAAKRFSLTGSGRVKRARAFANHILSTKTPKRKRRLRKSSLVDKTNERAIKRLVPYL
ncbi:MAG TPA: 50S ribosomal protein L35 [Syntrophales bacterium]|nr:50S ribosomal protein L35 [Syntrophales bacterium]HOM07739.1 50S ribosomal protein L35 [Syntrophales bacterium]HOO00402.1 50S ribosomal protein L35 [Syntrophales bacterium]HPC01749.1 50S ribosomal protein L35 [Syntrophales bacterium]HPQ07262.1 50S ribosomal protein L35 [Syntrophales bacterium]